LHPFDGWTFGAYAHEVGQFGIGEAKGTVNFVAGTAVSLSPELMLLDEQTGGRLSEPIATTGTQAAGSGFIQPVLFVATFFVDPEEVVALGGKGAKVLGRLKRDGCFIAGTPVQMADGSTKPIERVKAGDLVKSRNPRTGVEEAKRVLQTTVRQTGAILTLALVDPKTGHQEQITTTDEHPFYVAGTGFVKAGDLGIGTSIVTRAGPCLTLSHVTWAQEAPAGGGLRLGQASAGYTVYNLIVEGDHTYFVGTTGGGAWVHNVDCPIPTGLYKDIGGHHIHAKAGFNADGSAYDKDLALTVSDAEIDTWGGRPHRGPNSMTSKQTELFTQLRHDIATGARHNTMEEHNKIAVEVLMYGGVSKENALALVDRSLRNLHGQSIHAPNRIVGSPR